MRYQGSCHCGAIRFAFEGEPITRGLRCNCSMCSRRGALMSPVPIPKDELEIESEDDTLGLYQFGAHTAKHYFCKRCGVYPFHETARKPGHMRVNLGCVDGVEPLELEADLFDGKHLF